MRKIITLGSIKGGTGKSTIAIYLARFLSKTGKVLVIDTDLQRTTSKALVPNSLLKKNDPMNKKHIATALLEENLPGSIIPTKIENIDIVPATLHLCKYRSTPINSLKEIIHQVDDLYDYIIIDSAGTLDNITLMSYEAADYILTPVLCSSFDFDPAIMLRDRIKAETTVSSRWHLIFNCWGQRFEDEQCGDQTDYQQIFEKTFPNFIKTRIPQTKFARKGIDRDISVGNAKNTKVFRNSIISLAQEVTGESLSFEGAF